MSAAVKLGSPLKKNSRFINIKKYLNNRKHNFKLWVAEIIFNYKLKEKFSQILIWTSNIIITGGLIYYILNNNNLIAYGLAIVMFFYYFDKIVDKIKRPYDK